jgi:CAAX protease family protein
MDKNPLIRQGWLRVLLFLIFFLLIIFAASALVGVLILVAKKRTGSGQAPISIEDLMSGDYLWLTSIISLISSLMAVFVFRKFIDRKKFLSLGFEWKGYERDAGAGFFLAPVILGFGTLILYFSKHLQWTDISFDGNDLFIELGIMIMVAISEETVFRGYILSNLMESLNKWVALAISALLFTLFHLNNPGIGFIPILNIFIAGILLGLNYVYTKNLWFAILFHLSWNFLQGPILGYKVSGINLPTMLQTSLSGSELLTGGAFGFEGSVIALGLILITCMVLYLTYEKFLANKKEQAI